MFIIRHISLSTWSGWRRTLSVYNNSCHVLICANQDFNGRRSITPAWTCKTRLRFSLEVFSLQTKTNWLSSVATVSVISWASQRKLQLTEILKNLRLVHWSSEEMKAVYKTECSLAALVILHLSHLSSEFVLDSFWRPMWLLMLLKSSRTKHPLYI